MAKFFIAKVKCGHVGRQLFIPMNFFIYAKNGRDAAYMARCKPGVKRHHPDAVLSVTEITKEQFNILKPLAYNDPYWKKERMGVKNNQALFIDRLEPEIPRQVVRTNKMSARKFRYRRRILHEQSFYEEIFREYGIAV